MHTKTKGKPTVTQESQDYVVGTARIMTENELCARSNSRSSPTSEQDGQTKPKYDKGKMAGVANLRKEQKYKYTGIILSQPYKVIQKQRGIYL